MKLPVSATIRKVRARMMSMAGLRLAPMATWTAT
jgi:hypothetical protein